MPVDGPRGKALDLAVIGNCRTAALMDAVGRITVVVLSALRFRSGPFAPCWPATRRRGSATWCWRARSPRRAATCATRRSSRPPSAMPPAMPLRITDFMPRFKRFERVFNPPQIFRRIEPVAGLPRIKIRVRPTFNYGGPCASRASGSNHIRFSGGADTLRVTTDAALSYIAHETPFALIKPVTLILGPDEPFEAAVDTASREFLERTRDYWLDWVRSLAIPLEYPDRDHPRGDHAQALQFRGDGRHHRRAYHLDPRGAGHAAHLGLPLLLAARCILRHQGAEPPWRDADHGRVHPLHHQHRSRRPSARCGRSTASCRPSRSMSASPRSWRASRACGPVRVGNQAAEQLQHDAYGSVILAASQMFIDERLAAHGRCRSLPPARAAGRAGAALRDGARCRARGSIAARQRVHTHSATMCWVACDRLARIAARLGLADRAAHWRARGRGAAHMRS